MENLGYTTHTMKVVHLSLSGWMDPTGAMLLGCQGSSNTAGAESHGVRLLFKAVCVRIFIEHLLNTSGFLTCCWSIFQEVENLMTSHAGILTLSPAPTLISEPAVS